MTQEELAYIADEVARRVAMNTKRVLTLEEATEYLGIKKSYLYKLTSANKIPFYKSEGGKSCFFLREELEGWMTHQRVSIQEELQSQAYRYCKRVVL